MILTRKYNPGNVCVFCFPGIFRSEVDNKEMLFYPEEKRRYYLTFSVLIISLYIFVVVTFNVLLMFAIEKYHLGDVLAGAASMI